MTAHSLSPNRKIIFIFLFIGFILRATSQSIDTASYYQITNVLQGEKKAVTGMVNSTLGNAVMLRGNANHSMQQWSFVYMGNGNYRIINREHGPGLSVDVVNDGGNNNRITLAPSNKLSGQYWKITKNPDGSFRITSLWQGTDKALDFVKEGDKMNELILMPTTAKANNQAWRLNGTPKPQP